MVSVENVKGLLAILVGIAIFVAAVSMPKVNEFITANPLIVILVALFVFFKRTGIAIRIKKIVGGI